jgi:hypothetical protein
VRIFKTKWLTRYARRERIADRLLTEAIERAGRGLIDADLGGGLTSSGLRVAGRAALAAIACWSPIGKDRAVFLYAFAKNERDNIDADELIAFRAIGTAWLEADARRLAQALKDGRLQEVAND